jgi:hypothetical protein
VRRGDKPPGCHARCLHRSMVEAFHDAREAWERRREDWAIGYATERAEYAEVTGDAAPNFRDWLKAWAGQWREDDSDPEAA